MRLEAPAKLNLSLSVLDRRPDGFHELASVVVLIDLADRLMLMPGCSGLRVEGAAGEVPVEVERNLAWRGLLAGMGREPDLACLAVEKRIPVAAGLGGGSADAAAAWRLGRRWHGASDVPSVDDLRALATIGADVPFLASAVPAALVTGVGERVRPLPAPEPPLSVVLVDPPFGLSTVAVFEELRRADWSRASPSPEAVRVGGNDLLAPARRLRPELDDLYALVSAAGGDPRLSGSGATVFSVSDDPERSEAVARRLASAGLRVTTTRTRRLGARIEAVGAADGEMED